jgi:hypothetical protein
MNFTTFKPVQPNFRRSDFPAKIFFAIYPNFGDDNENIGLMHVCGVIHHSNARKLSFSAIVCTGAMAGW